MNVVAGFDSRNHSIKVNFSIRTRILFREISRNHTKYCKVYISI